MGKKTKIGITSLVVSICALIIAIVAYLTSQEALKLERARERREKAPGVILSKDSENINFSVAKDNVRLRTIFMKLPDAIRVPPLIIEKPAEKLKVKAIESIVLTYFLDKIAEKESFEIVEEVRIPVVIDYEVVVGKESRLFREDHFLVFFISSKSGWASMSFDRSIFNFKLEIPLESHYFFRLPFTEPTNAKIIDADMADVKKYLNIRFSDTVDFLKYKGIIR